jgi:hypothetical protein
MVAIQTRTPAASAPWESSSSHMRSELSGTSIVAAAVSRGTLWPLAGGLGAMSSIVR